jgi:hypothetical protein
MDIAAATLADSGDAEAYSVALDHWLAAGAADLDERMPVVLADLGLDSGTVRPDVTPMTALSAARRPASGWPH